MTIGLRANQVLTVTADASSAGRVQRIPQSGSTTAYAASELSASSSVTIGPYSTDRQYLITSTAGLLTYAITDGEPTADSAGLASSLSDETGTGAAVFGTSPSLTTPAITGGTVSGATITTSSSSGISANLTTIATAFTIPANSLSVLWNSFTVGAGGSLTVAGTAIVAPYPS